MLEQFEEKIYLPEILEKLNNLDGGSLKRILDFVEQNKGKSYISHIKHDLLDNKELQSLFLTNKPEVFDFLCRTFNYLLLKSIPLLQEADESDIRELCRQLRGKDTLLAEMILKDILQKKQDPNN